MAGLTASSLFICLQEEPSTSTRTHAMTHPETQHSHSRLKISKFWDKKTLPTTILQRFLLLQFVYSQDILSELAGYGPKGMFFLIFFFAVFLLGLENLNRDLKTCFENTSSTMKTECCMHEQAFTFINEEINCL